MSKTRSQAKARSMEFGAAMQRSAERRQCPKCQRKSALVREDWATWCRWCDYIKEAAAIRGGDH